MAVFAASWFHLVPPCQMFWVAYLKRLSYVSDVITACRYTSSIELFTDDEQDVTTLWLKSVYPPVTSQNCHYDEFNHAQCYQRMSVPIREPFRQPTRQPYFSYHSTTIHNHEIEQETSTYTVKSLQFDNMGNSQLFFMYFVVCVILIFIIYNKYSR